MANTINTNGKGSVKPSNLGSYSDSSPSFQSVEDHPQFLKLEKRQTYEKKLFGLFENEVKTNGICRAVSLRMRRLDELAFLLERKSSKKTKLLQIFTDLSDLLNNNKSLNGEQLVQQLEEILGRKEDV